MASTKSPEFSSTEMELKRRGRRRLIGAATIGLLGIVFLPMIFDGEPKSNRAGTNLKPQQISVQIPDKEGQPPLPAPTAIATPATAPAVEIAKSIPVEAPKPAAEVAPPVLPPAPAAAKAEKAKVVAKAAPQVVEKKGFVVQLGAFGDADKAKLAVATMKSAKLTVYTESIATNKGTVTRVRVGPFPTREKADSALAQVKLAGSDGKIVPLQ